jgi:hypothetical protein
VLHGALLAGVLSVGTILLLLRSSADVPPPVPSAAISIALSMLAIGLVAVSVRLSARLIGRRTREQTADAFWGEPQRRNGSILLWGALEGAALLGSVGYYLTGRLAPLAAFAIAAGTLFLMRPGRFEDEGA